METKGTGTILVLIVVVVAAAAAKAIRTMKRIIIIIVKRVEENPRAAASTKSFVYTVRKSNLSVKRPSPGSNRKKEVFSCAPMLVLAG